MKRRYNNIDSLRFIASLGIVMVHVLKNIDFYDMPSQGVYGYISTLFLMRMENWFHSVKDSTESIITVLAVKFVKRRI